MLIEKIHRLKESKIKISSANSNWASRLGHPCERMLVYERTAADKKTGYGVETQTVFDEGKMHERAILQELLEVGVEIFDVQRAFELKDFNIRGRVDFKITDNGDRHNLIPVEIKSITPYVFDKINKVEDFSKYWWMVPIPGQLTLYMLGENHEKGLWILKNRGTGQLKEIEYNLDWDYADSLCKKAERINEAVEAINNPDPDPQVEYFLPEKLNQVDHCDHCDFKAHCCPDLSYGDGLELSDNKELEKMLELRESLRENYKEYGKIDKIVKAKIKGASNVLIGRFHVSGKWVDKKAYDVKASQYWKADIAVI